MPLLLSLSVDWSFLCFCVSFYVFFPLTAVTKHVQLQTSSHLPLHPVPLCNFACVRIFPPTPDPPPLHIGVDPHSPLVSQSKSASSPVSPPAQVQLIRDNTTPASPATPATPLTPGEGAQSPGEQVQMTWTEKCDGEPAKPPGAATPEGIKDIFNMKP